MVAEPDLGSGTVRCVGSSPVIRTKLLFLIFYRMNILKENINENSGALLRLQIVREDYEPRVNKVLGDYKRKASIDGFRPGKVPPAIIKKLYGKPVLVDEINKLVSESLNNYLKDNQIDIIGDPIPSEKEQKTINFDTDSVFEFVFEVGLTPAFEVQVSENDLITYYNIKVEEKAIDNYVDMCTRRFGEYLNAAEAGEKDLLKADIAEVDESGRILENGIKSLNTSLSIEIIKDSEIKQKMTGVKIGDKKIIDIKKAYPNDFEISQILKIKREEVAYIHHEFEITVLSVSAFKEAEVNQDLFDKVFGQDQVKSDIEFREKIKEQIGFNYSRESDFKFKSEIKDYFISKISFELPGEFLKRWLILINEGKFTKEQIEKDYLQFEIDLKWQIIKNKIVKIAGIQVGEDEVLYYAHEITRNQMHQYGMYQVPEETLDQYAKQLLSKETETKRIVEGIIEDKILHYVKEHAKLDMKEITVDEFNRFFEKKD